MSAHAGTSRTATAAAAIDHALFAIVPMIVTGWLLVHVARAGIVAVDFRDSFWVAAHRLLHGGNPYAWTREQILNGISFPYPAPAALLLLPFALLPAAVASGIATALCIAGVLLALRVLRVEDWRLYGVVLVLSPVVVGWQTGNVSLLLTLGLALAWRWRDRPVPLGLLVALLISLKPITAPLVVWALMTDGRRAAAVAFVGTIALNLAAWSLVGWSELGGWAHLLTRQSSLLFRRGYGVMALAAHLGAGHVAGTLLTVGLLGLGTVLSVWAAHTRGRGAAFAVAVVLMLVVSPQVDSHYLALLLAPLAIAQPRLSWAWFAPLALWVCPASQADLTQILLWWMVVLVLLVACLAPRRSTSALRVGALGPAFRLSPSARQGVMT